MLPSSHPFFRDSQVSLTPFEVQVGAGRFAPSLKPRHVTLNGGKRCFTDAFALGSRRHRTSTKTRGMELGNPKDFRLGRLGEA